MSEVSNAIPFRYFRTMANGMEWKEECPECHRTDCIVVEDELENPHLVCTHCNPHGELDGDGVLAPCWQCERLVDARREKMHVCTDCEESTCDDCIYKSPGKDKVPLCFYCFVYRCNEHDEESEDGDFLNMDDMRGEIEELQ
jgi:hypothetical protein